MTKFLFIAANEWAPWGGSEALWSQAAAKLAERGMEVCVSVKDWGEPVKEVEQLRSAGCRIFQRRQPSLLDRLSRRVFPRREYAWEHVHELGAGAELVVISQGLNIDGLGWMEAAKDSNYSYVVVAQAAADYTWPRDDLAERLATVYEEARAAYFVSNANLSLTRRQLVTPLGRARVIRNPYNVRYDARPPWSGDPAIGLSLACVARLDGGTKGHDLLFQVLALPHWRSRDVQVSLVGGGPNERGLRRLAGDLRLRNLEFLGHQSDIEAVWKKHHAMVLPSRHEGMPLAVVEAMLCGRACIVTDVGGNRELVRDGENGFVAKAATVELLDEAMNRAWESRGRLREMGERAARDVREWVSADPVEDFVRDLEGLVDGAVAK